MTPSVTAEKPRAGRQGTTFLRLSRDQMRKLSRLHDSLVR
jgi:hypothetical protein